MSYPPDAALCRLAAWTRGRRWNLLPDLLGLVADNGENALVAICLPDGGEHAVEGLGDH